MSKLTRIGIIARYNSNNHIQSLNILRLKGDTVVFEIIHSGSTTDIMNSVRLAQENGLKIPFLQTSKL